MFHIKWELRWLDFNGALNISGLKWFYDWGKKILLKDKLDFGLRKFLIRESDKIIITTSSKS